MEFLSGQIGYDIERDFNLRNNFEESKLTDSNKITNEITDIKQMESNHTEQLNDVIRTLPFMNDNIRTNIRLGMEIYYKLNNFDRYYIHSIINENSIKHN
jgi:hypothetical protein